MNSINLSTNLTFLKITNEKSNPAFLKVIFSTIILPESLDSPPNQSDPPPKTISRTEIERNECAYQGVPRQIQKSPAKQIPRQFLAGMILRVCRLVAGRARGLESEFLGAIRETKFQLTDREKGGPGALDRDPPNRMAVANGGSAETTCVVQGINIRG